MDSVLYVIKPLSKLENETESTICTQTILELVTKLEQVSLALPSSESLEKHWALHLH